MAVGGRREGAGRPRVLAEGEARSVPLRVRVSEGELERWTAIAEALGVTVSEMVRAAVNAVCDRESGRR
jgi:hypothetical protein